MPDDIISVQVTSHLPEVEQYLANAIQTALETIGQRAERYAKLECPYVTGRLRNSITHQVALNEQAVYIGTNVEYAPYVELGTSKRDADPFLRPAAENHSAEYKSIVKQTLSNA